MKCLLCAMRRKIFLLRGAISVELEGLIGLLKVTRIKSFPEETVPEKRDRGGILS